jgi:hypothetical protein
LTGAFRRTSHRRVERSPGAISAPLRRVIEPRRTQIVRIGISFAQQLIILRLVLNRLPGPPELSNLHLHTTVGPRNLFRPGCCKSPSASFQHHSSSTFSRFSKPLMPTGCHSFGHAVACSSLFDYLHTQSLHLSFSLFLTLSLMIRFDFSTRLHRPLILDTRPTTPPQHVLTTPSRSIANLTIVNTRTRTQVFAANTAIGKQVSYQEAASCPLGFANQSALGSNHSHSQRCQRRRL